MKHHLLIICCFGLAYTSKAQQAPSYIADSLQNILDDFLVSDTVPGGIVSVYDRANNWTWKGQSGLADVYTMTPSDTTFSYRIGSVSKNFMATTILHISENGMLSLNDTIGQWLNPTLLDSIPFSGSMTVRSMLDHTSGIYNYTDDSTFLVSLLTDTNAYWTPDDLIGIALSHPPDFTPLSAWAYNNTGYVILTKIIQAATGMPYHVYATDSILTPLGLSNTYYPDTNIIPVSHMKCYADFDNNSIYEDYTDITTTWAVGAGEIVSNLDDQIAYFNGLLDGSIISAAAYAQMRAPLFPAPVTYGLGMYILNDTIVGHKGLYFSTTGLWYYEDIDVVMAYQFNLMDVDDIGAVVMPIHQFLISQPSGLDQITTGAISVFPNPATTEINIHMQNGSTKQFTIDIYSVTGQKVKTIKPSGENTSIDIRDLKKGIHLIAVTDENDLRRTMKVIKN